MTDKIISHESPDVAARRERGQRAIALARFLGKTPAGRWERVVDLYAPWTEHEDGTIKRSTDGGTIDKDDALKLLDFPDLADPEVIERVHRARARAEKERPTSPTVVAALHEIRDFTAALRAHTAENNAAPDESGVYHTIDLLGDEDEGA